MKVKIELSELEIKILTLLLDTDMTQEKAAGILGLNSSARLNQILGRLRKKLGVNTNALYYILGQMSL
ncbi:MAG: hypothetical protein RLZZ292_4071 [Bacteroidota bacterium]|jgi:predicted DNA-binding protein (UPF0251 family)